MADEHNSGVPRPAGFASTQWSLVIAAGQRSLPESQRALGSLCRNYWSPLYAYARRRVSDREEARDLTQAFFAELLEKNFLAAATPERGRFRAFLLSAFKHFLSKQWGSARAQKRGGGRAVLSLDFDQVDSRYRIEPVTEQTAEQLYDRQWALTLLHHVMQQLADEFLRDGKADQFQELKPFLIGQQAGTTYADVATRLGSTEGAVKMAVQRMRQRYRHLLRQEIAQTVDGPDQVDAEICNLFASLAV